MKIFTPVWNKYRPAILKMMIDSSESPQTYKLSPHEFKAMELKPKGGFTFVLQVSKGQSLNNIKNSGIAQDLLGILQLSKKATELSEESPYQIALDKQFVLHVHKILN